jgi:hypothetical protein
MSDGKKSGSSLISINLNLPKFEGIPENFEKCYSNTLRAVQAGIAGVWRSVSPAVEARIDRSALRSNANAIIDLAKLNADLEKLDLDNADPFKRAMVRLLNNAVREQENRERIVDLTLDEIRSNPVLSDSQSDISDDWMANFWDYAQKISDDSVRIFFAKILSSEVKIPNTISPVTIQTLSTLTRDVANRFQHFCRLSIDDGNNVFVVHPHVYDFQDHGPLDKYGIGYEDIEEFASYRLILSAKVTKYQYSKDNSAQNVDYAGQSAVLNLAGIQTNEFRFSRVGREIRRIISLEPMPKYTDVLKGKLGGQFNLSGV